MSNDMRIVKFKMMIRDIWEDLGKEALTYELDDFNDGWGMAWLAIVYDYDKLNDYGKAIMEQVCALDEDEFGDDEEFSYIVESVENCKDMKYRMKAAKALVMDLNGNEIKSYFDSKERKGMHFIFWSLMILAVDDTDKEEYLSLICDFAKMLHISDLEMMDIVQVIQGVFHKTTEKIIAPKVLDHFGKVIKRYGFKASAGTTDALNSSINSIFGSLLKQ